MHKQKYRAFTLLVLVLHKEVVFLGRQYKTVVKNLGFPTDKPGFELAFRIHVILTCHCNLPVSGSSSVKWNHK